MFAYGYMHSFLLGARILAVEIKDTNWTWNKGRSRCIICICITYSYLIIMWSVAFAQAGNKWVRKENEPYGARNIEWGCIFCVQYTLWIIPSSIVPYKPLITSGRWHSWCSYGLCIRIVVMLQCRCWILVILALTRRMIIMIMHQRHNCD